MYLKGYEFIIAYFSLLQLVSSEVSDDRLWMTTEDNCSVSFLSDSQASASRTSTITTSQEFYLYSVNSSVSCIDNESDHCSFHYCVNENCRCTKKFTTHDILHCSEKRNLSVLSSFCVTYNEDEDITEVGNCIYNSDISDLYYVLPKSASKLNEAMCGKFNRNGTLCGKCKDGFFPLAYSFNMTCVKCPNGRSNWWKYVLSAFLPLTVFYFIVVFCKINATSSPLHGFIYYNQAISGPQMVRLLFLATEDRPKYQTVVKYLATFYGVWNLDFFRSFDLGICLETDTLQNLALDMAVGTYPLLLMVLSYFLIHLYDNNFRPLVILWKPFRKVFSLFRSNWEIRTSIVDAFATFLLLSNIKFLSVSHDLLAPVKVFLLSPSKDLNPTWRVFYDANVPYFGRSHLPYAIMAITILIIFVLLPILILLLYPCNWFQRLLNVFPVNWQVVHTFVDSFQGCYKDGTEAGTRDCRWFASFFFIIRITVVIVGIISTTSMYYVLSSMLMVLFVILLIFIQPFKTNLSHYSNINAVFFLLFISWYVSVIGLDMASFKKQDVIWPFYILCLIFGVLPALYGFAIILYWIFSQRKFGFELIRRVRAFRQGYDWLALE